MQPAESTITQTVPHASVGPRAVSRFFELTSGIDSIDDEIMTLLGRRSEKMAALGRLEPMGGDEGETCNFSRIRELNSLDRLVRLNHSMYLPTVSVKRIMHVVFAESRLIEQSSRENPIKKTQTIVTSDDGITDR